MILQSSTGQDERADPWSPTPNPHLIPSYGRLASMSGVSYTSSTSMKQVFTLAIRRVSTHTMSTITFQGPWERQNRAIAHSLSRQPNKRTAVITQQPPANLSIHYPQNKRNSGDVVAVLFVNDPSVLISCSPPGNLKYRAKQMVNRQVSSAGDKVTYWIAVVYLDPVFRPAELHLSHPVVWKSSVKWRADFDFLLEKERLTVATSVNLLRASMRMNTH